MEDYFDKLIFEQRHGESNTKAIRIQERYFWVERKKYKGLETIVYLASSRHSKEGNVVQTE
jgi:hypothetical protein